MLTELCQYCRNWFNRKPNGDWYPRFVGVFTISNGALITNELTEGQYFRIMGSLLNDGVHKYGVDILKDETFEGAVWSMGVPPAVVQLAADIKTWQDKYGGIDSENMSPYQSESFGGYSYSKSGGGTSDGVSGAGTWQAAFAKRLNPWRKV